MKINFEVVLLDPLGEGPLLTPQKHEPLTLGFACRYALMYGHADQGSTVEDHMKRDELSTKLAGGGIVDLRPEDVEFLKRALPTGWKISAIVATAVKALVPVPEVIPLKN